MLVCRALVLVEQIRRPQILLNGGRKSVDELILCLPGQNLSCHSMHPGCLEIVVQWWRRTSSRGSADTTPSST
jgi:hypothetical protein